MFKENELVMYGATGVCKVTKIGRPDFCVEDEERLYYFISYDDIDSMVSNVDVMIICGGSAVDLPKITPYLATKFNIIDSFDTHARIDFVFRSLPEASQ